MGLKQLAESRHHADRDLLKRYALEEVPRKAKRIAQHVAACPHCAAKLEVLQRDIDLIRHTFSAAPLGQNDSPEHRSEPRTPVRTLTQLVQMRRHGTGLITDVSAKGLGVLSSFRLQVGKLLRVLVDGRRAEYLVLYSTRTPEGWRSGLLHTSFATRTRASQ